MADPLSVTSDFYADAEADDWFEDNAQGYSADYNTALDLSGWHGIRAVFAEWSGFHYFNQVATATGGIGMSTGAQASQALIQSNYPGVCAGAYNKLSVPLPDPILDSTCGGWEEISAAKKSEYVRESEEMSIHFRNMYPECAYYFDGT